MNSSRATDERRTDKGIFKTRSIADLDRHMWSVPSVVLQACSDADNLDPTTLMNLVRDDLASRYADYKDAGFLTPFAVSDELVSITGVHWVCLTVVSFVYRSKPRNM